MMRTTSKAFDNDGKEKAGMVSSENRSLSSSPHAADARYWYDAEKLRQLKSDAPWMKNPKYFQSVAVSPTAVMKIMMHCQSGVDKGIAKGGNPIEVMGLLLGRPDPNTPETLVVTDAFPLPIEGFETRVVADDQNVTNHMISLGDSLELTRKERFMGWYHSHPFDLGENSHCFLSQTDLSTQLQWQRAEDPHGNPFVAIVVDPLRSVHTGTPELKAFRAYPPEFTSPTPNECPDSSIEVSERQRLELWGSCWSRYYELKVEYFMSRTSRKLLSSLTQDYLWMSTLTNQPFAKLSDNLTNVSKKFHCAANTPVETEWSRTQAGHVETTGETKDNNSNKSSSKIPVVLRSATAGSAVSFPFSARTQEWNKAVNELTDLASEQLAEATLLETKRQIFS